MPTLNLKPYSFGHRKKSRHFCFITNEELNVHERYKITIHSVRSNMSHTLLCHFWHRPHLALSWNQQASFPRLLALLFIYFIQEIFTDSQIHNSARIWQKRCGHCPCMSWHLCHPPHTQTLSPPGYLFYLHIISATSFSEAFPNFWP